MRRMILALGIVAALFANGHAWAEAPPTLSITGVVNHPVTLSPAGLALFQSIEVQLGEVLRSGEYRGTFLYRGVPLKALLETVDIAKRESDFKKRIDLAIVVKNREGRQITLSWGEVFYRNAGDIIVGLSARPIIPHKDCTKCHEPEVFKPRLDQLHRQIGFPKLVVTGDEYADRSLEGITSIQVVDLKPVVPDRDLERLFSPEFVITGAVQRQVTVTDISGLPRQAANARHLGEGRGYHGIDRVEGVPFKAVLDQAGIAWDLNTVFMISAPDGYRSLVSYGEVFLGAAGDRMLIADTRNGETLKKDGRFMFVPLADQMADRDVKAIEKIEVIRLGTFFSF